jgi:hypothetical protein
MTEWPELVDYIEFARDRLNDILPVGLDGWTREELAEIADAADTLADRVMIVEHRRQDRETLRSWLG